MRLKSELYVCQINILIFLFLKGLFKKEMFDMNKRNEKPAAVLTHAYNYIMHPFLK